MITNPVFVPNCMDTLQQQLQARVERLIHLQHVSFSLHALGLTIKQAQNVVNKMNTQHRRYRTYHRKGIFVVWRLR
jgi:hypothetical protein